MDELSCRQCRDLAAELALNILAGRERGDTVRHLDRCPTCRNEVRELTNIADQLIDLIADAPPPAEFEDRVVTALIPDRPLTLDRPRPRAAAKRTAAILGAVLLVGAGLVGNGAVGALPKPAHVVQPGELTVRYAPLVGDNQQVGEAYFYPGDPPWIYLSLAAVKAPAMTGSVSCEVVRQDGTTSPLGSIPLDHGHGSWAGPAPTPPDNLAAALLVDQTGHTLATARFTPEPTQSSPDTAQTTAQFGPTRNVQHPGPTDDPRASRDDQVDSSHANHDPGEPVGRDAAPEGGHKDINRTDGEDGNRLSHRGAPGSLRDITHDFTKDFSSDSTHTNDRHRADPAPDEAPKSSSPDPRRPGHDRPTRSTRDR